VNILKINAKVGVCTGFNAIKHVALLRNRVRHNITAAIIVKSRKNNVFLFSTFRALFIVEHFKTPVKIAYLKNVKIKLMLFKLT